MRTILFVCTGNTCRSPMAEGIARNLVKSGVLEGLDAAQLLFASAGVAAFARAEATHDPSRKLRFVRSTCSAAPMSVSR